MFVGRSTLCGALSMTHSVRVRNLPQSSPTEIISDAKIFFLNMLTIKKGCLAVKTFFPTTNFFRTARIKILVKEKLLLLCQENLFFFASDIKKGSTVNYHHRKGFALKCTISSHCPMFFVFVVFLSVPCETRPLTPNLA